jgi:hypothetical protein
VADELKAQQRQVFFGFGDVFCHARRVIARSLEDSHQRVVWGGSLGT